jgi:hypothetical protein
MNLNMSGGKRHHLGISYIVYQDGNLQNHVCTRDPSVSPTNTHTLSLLVEGCGNGKLRSMTQNRAPMTTKYEMNTVKAKALANSMVF